MAQEVGITEESAIPSSVNSQSGELARVVRWVKQANERLGNSKDWRWLRKEFTLTTTAGTDTYSSVDCIDVETGLAIDRFKSWRLQDRENPPKLYLQTAGVAGQIHLNYASWDQFSELYKFGSLQTTQGFPNHVTIDPDDNLVLGQVPNDIYVINGFYNRSGQVLAADDDIPDMPGKYHDIIMYRAIRYYALFESAPEAFAQFKEEYGVLRRQLNRNQAPKLRKARSMA